AGGEDEGAGERLPAARDGAGVAPAAQGDAVVVAVGGPRRVGPRTLGAGLEHDATYGGGPGAFSRGAQNAVLRTAAKRGKGAQASTLSWTLPIWMMSLTASGLFWPGYTRVRLT